MKASLFKEMMAGLEEAVKYRRGQKARVRVIVGFDSAPVRFRQSEHGVSRSCVVHEARGFRT